MEQSNLNFESAMAAEQGTRRALKISELTERIQGLLESEFIDVWVEGEISNLTIAASGHWYFSLKDEKAQIRAVVWKGTARSIRFRPKEGMQVVARGNVRVYPPKGEYQIAVEKLEPLGKGALQQAFEELRDKLNKEGLFDPARKRRLPMLPRCIGVVTSPTGAVIRDILRVLARRYANLNVVLYPARVQGEGAAAEIVAGIRVLGRLPGIDVVIVARGGGSLEDLWPFNEESVARALAACPRPTISAVGHETDFTIADFVADVRAPTPSAAAEIVVQAKDEFHHRIEAQDRRLQSALGMTLARLKARVQAATQHRVFAAEQGRLRVHAQRVDDLARRSQSALARRSERARAEWRRLAQRLEAFRLDRQLAMRRERIIRHTDRMVALTRALIETRRSVLARLCGKIDGLSPLAVLARGYALVWDPVRERLVRQPDEVEIGAALRLRISGGQLSATVTGKESA